MRARADGPSYLVIGCGSIGCRHAVNLASVGVREILLYDPDIERARDVASACGGAACRSLAEAFERAPRAALICSPNNLHVDLASQAVQRGMHVFIEKPLSHHLSDVAAFMALSSERDVQVVVGYNFRFDPLLVGARDAVRRGRIGSPLSARFHVGSYLPNWHPGEDYRRGYSARSDLGGGVILDAIHEIDMALFMFGLPKSVYCIGGHLSELEIDVEDVADCLFRYEKLNVSVHLNYVQDPRKRRFEIIGTKGQIECDFVERALRVYESTRGQWETSPAEITPDQVYVEEMRHFVACVNGEIRSSIDARVGVESLLMACAARKSMETGEPVTIGPDALTT